MKRVNEILLVIIFTLTAVLAAAVGLKAYDIYDTNRRLAREQEEMELAQVLARNEEVQSRVVQLQKEILELAEDREELERFINRLENSELLSAVEDLADGTGTVSSNDMVSGNNSTVSSNAAVSGNGTMTSDGMISGNDTVSSNSTVSGNGTVSSNSTVSGNGMMRSRRAGSPGSRAYFAWILSLS